MIKPPTGYHFNKTFSQILDYLCSTSSFLFNILMKDDTTDSSKENAAVLHLRTLLKIVAEVSYFLKIIQSAK